MIDSNTLFPILTLMFSLSIIFVTSNGFVKTAIQIAHVWHVPVLYIGTFLIGLSTSLPEIIVTTIASVDGAIDLSIGNILGSCIFNIGFIISITAFIKPLSISTETLGKAMPALALSTILTSLLLMIDNQFSATDGIILLGLSVILLILCAQYIQKNPKRFTSKQIQPLPNHPQWQPWAWFLLYLSGLLWGCELFVNAAIKIATLLHINELVIGLTIVALGTSIPELAASITAAYHNEDDIAIGNIIGSNIFCLLCILPIPLILAPPQRIVPDQLWISLGTMLGITILLWLFSAKFDKTCKINRMEASILLLISIAYLVNTCMQN